VNYVTSSVSDIRSAREFQGNRLAGGDVPALPISNIAKGLFLFARDISLAIARLTMASLWLDTADGREVTISSAEQSKKMVK
jgi:hypothetical protein